MTGSDRERRGAAALADLFETHYERVARYIAVHIGDREQAEELAADVFVRALGRIDSYEWRGIPMQAWIFRIAHNLVVDHLRRWHDRATAPMSAAASVPAPDNPGEEALLNIQREELLKAMESLSPAQREVLTLRFFGELSSAEAAKVMKRSNGAVRQLQSSALKALRQVLESSGSKVVGREAG